MDKVSQQRLVSWLLKANRGQRRGFTLIELLVSIIIGSIIVSALLFLVTELNRFNGREELLTDTQQNMRRALDFMASDAGEAVFLYSETPTDIINQLTPDPAFPEATEATPILTFWRLDPVDTNGLNCASFPANSDAEAECTTLLVRHSAYTLVVYLQTNDNTDSPIWGGPTRIIRYQLAKYQDGGVDTLTQRNGYLDPSLEETDFATWTADTGETPSGVAQVLTDHVAALQEGALIPATVLPCPDLDGDGVSEYDRTPANSNNFYVCVRSGETNNTVAGFEEGLLNRTNQSLILNLTGNAARGDNDILVGTSGQAGQLPALRSEVLIRGVIEKPRD